MAKIKISDWTEHTAGAHPVSGQDDGPYAQIALGDLAGLSQFGVHLERLPPGSRSSHRHWHRDEDEFMYLISGQLVLIEDEEILLEAGDAAGWRAGQPTAHCLENRSVHEAVMLVVGTRSEVDVVQYPDHDLILHKRGQHRTYTRIDGTVIGPET